MEQLQQEELFTLIEEVPSDNESIVSEEDDEEETVIERDLVPEANDIIMNSMETKSFTGTNGFRSDNAGVESDDWDSEDELPLAAVLIPSVASLVKGIQWEKSVTNVILPTPFVESFGPNLPDNIETPLDIFLTLFSEELLENIVFQTNLYCTQNITRNTQPPVTLDEIKCFLGLNLLMGITKKAQLQGLLVSTFRP